MKKFKNFINEDEDEFGDYERRDTKRDKKTWKEQRREKMNSRYEELERNDETKENDY